MDLEEVIRDYLPRVVHMSLATSKDNKPWICEVHFVYDDNLNLYFRSLPSRRHSQEIAANPQVAGNIIKQHAVGEPVRGVYFEGMASMVTADSEQRAVAELMVERLAAAKSILAEAKDPNNAQFYQVSVTSFYIFGDLDGQGNNKYQLRWSRT